MIFKRISRPYLNHYGPPDKEFKYTYEFKHYVDWLWWMQGMIVTFTCLENKEIGWWKGEEAHYFDPNIKNVEGEDLKYVFEQMIGYGEPKKYSEIFRECEKIKFNSKLLCSK
jgi:hypothetical protein